jgi:hypothetical protein
VLVARCKDIIQRFVSEEKQSGLMPLPRSRLMEVTGVLESIK